jgi:hypothetical protein
MEPRTYNNNNIPNPARAGYGEMEPKNMKMLFDPNSNCRQKDSKTNLIELVKVCSRLNEN